MFAAAGAVAAPTDHGPSGLGAQARTCFRAVGCGASARPSPAIRWSPRGCKGLDPEVSRRPDQNKLFGKTRTTSEEDTAKLSPSKPLSLKVFTPITLPDRLINGPPLFPGFKAASI